MTSLMGDHLLMTFLQIQTNLIFCERLFSLCSQLKFLHEGTEIDVCLSDELLVVIDNNASEKCTAENAGGNVSISENRPKTHFKSSCCYWLVATLVLLSLLLLIALLLANRDFVGPNLFGACNPIWLKKTWTNGPPPT